jgi:hypothetical protein
MPKIWDANNFRRTTAGLCLIAAPLVFGMGEVIRLSIEGDSAGLNERLENVAANPGLWQTMTILNMISVILFVPAGLGIPNQNGTKLGTQGS